MGERVASFHLASERATRAPAVLAHLALDRRALADTAGVRFWKLMGTGRGRSTSLSIDPCRVALFAVWDDDDALRRFVDRSPISARWRTGREHYVARLTRIDGGGRWAGSEPLASMPSTTPEPAAHVAVLTRASVRLHAWGAFARAGRKVSARLAAADGLVRVAGIGEAPLGRQATFSIWRDVDAMEHFAYSDAVHRAVIERTRSERWYGDELFARFAARTIEGTWDGSDPLAEP